MMRNAQLGSLIAVAVLLISMARPVSAEPESSPSSPIATSAPDSPSAGPGPGTTAGAPSASDIACKTGDPDSRSSANLKYVVTLDSSTTWQPRGGEIKFSIEAEESLPASIRVVTCFGWPEGLESKISWIPGASVRVLSIDQKKIYLAARVPNLESARYGWPSRILGRALGQYTGMDIVPVSDFRILAMLPDSTLDIAIPVGVTSHSYSLILAISILVIAWLVLYWMTSKSKIQGSDVFLRVIATRSGYASLSQFQILVWTFVIGGAAMYVMALSGNLIDISPSTLILLGISGLTTVGAKYQSSLGTAGASSAASSQSVPGAVNSLSLTAAPTESTVSLLWFPPEGGEPVSGYRVMFKPTGTTLWSICSDSYDGCRFVFVELLPSTAYDFRVQATNDNGAGLPTDISATTAPQTIATGTPPAVLGLSIDGAPMGDRIKLAWSPVLGTGITYCVQSRQSASADAWKTESGTVSKPNYIVRGLFADTDYDFRIIASNAQGSGVPSARVSATTALRVPGWTDLLIPDDRRREVDVTRFQMLFFTIISAIFVGMRVLVSDQVPELPEGFLALMGISNGVYLTAKFVPR